MAYSNFTDRDQHTTAKPNHLHSNNGLYPISEKSIKLQVPWKVESSQIKSHASDLMLVAFLLLWHRIQASRLTYLRNINNTIWLLTPQQSLTRHHWELTPLIAVLMLDIVQKQLSCADPLPHNCHTFGSTMFMVWIQLKSFVQKFATSRVICTRKLDRYSVVGRHVKTEVCKQRMQNKTIGVTKVNPC